MGTEDFIENTEDGFLRIKKIPLEDLLGILEGLYESGCNYIDMEFKIDPNDVQNVLSITTRPEYMATEEELEQEEKMYEELGLDDDDEEDDEEDILDAIKKRQQEEDINPISDDEINELM